MESKVSGHWTDDRLIAHLYGLEAEDEHFRSCADCQVRVSRMAASRRAVEEASSVEPGFEFLAAQRRQIYAQLTKPQPWWSQGQLRRWASAAMAVLVLGGGILFYEENQHAQQPHENSVSDVQLAQEMSNMTQESEAPSTAPLQALFEE